MNHMSLSSTEAWAAVLVTAGVVFVLGVIGLEIWEWCRAFDRHKLIRLEREMGTAGFWDRADAREVAAEHARLTRKVARR